MGCRTTLIATVLAAFLTGSWASAQDEVPFGPLGVEAHSLFQTPGMGFVPDMPLQLKEDEVVIRTSIASSNVYNATDRYLVDLEYERFRFDFWYGLSNKVSFGISIPVERVSGGYLDGLINGFHKWARIPSKSKGGPQNSLGVSIDGKQYDIDRSTTLGDITLSTNYEISKFFCDDYIVGWYAGLHVKLPTAHSQLYDSFGPGVGVSTNFLIQCDSWSFDAGASIAYVGDFDILGVRTTPYQEQVFITLEKHLCGIFSIVGQTLMQSGTARSLSQYSKWSYELDLGFKVAIANRTIMQFGMFENVANFGNSADFGVFVGFEHRY